MVKFEENTKIIKENLDYDKKYKEIQKLIRKEEIEQKKNLKILRTSQKSGSVKNPMKSSLKDLVKGVLPAINVQRQGNVEANILPLPSFPK
jgi:hypothetical protein